MNSIVRFLIGTFRNNVVVGLIVALAFSAATVKSIRHHFKSSDDVFLNRLWIDRLPETMKDNYSLYVFTDEELDGDVNFGFHVSGMPVKYTIEIFGFQHCPANIQFLWLADDSKNKSNYAVSKEKNGEFDLKLVVKNDPRHGGREHVYYSSTEWDEGKLKTLYKEAMVKVLGLK